MAWKLHKLHKCCALLAAAALVSACGGGGGDDQFPYPGGNNPGPNNPTPNNPAPNNPDPNGPGPDNPRPNDPPRNPAPVGDNRLQGFWTYLENPEVFSLNVLEDGRFYGFFMRSGSNPRSFHAFGQMHETGSGNDVGGSQRIYDSALDAMLELTPGPRETVVGRHVPGVGHGTLQMQFDGMNFTLDNIGDGSKQVRATLQQLAGSYEGIFYSTGEYADGIEFSISPSGDLVDAGTAPGCSIRGSVSPEAKRNVFDVELELSGTCSPHKGATADSTPVSGAIIIAPRIFNSDPILSFDLFAETEGQDGAAVMKVVRK